MYGPDLVDRATGADTMDGPAAALVYPVPTAPPMTVRTATFTVSEPDALGGTQNYEVTADFESGVAHVVVPRVDTPDLEILTLWDQAFIRRIDEPTWYTLPRGTFPIDFPLGRARWIRTLDELVPPEFRSITTVAEANESTVGADPTLGSQRSPPRTRCSRSRPRRCSASASERAHGTPLVRPPCATAQRDILYNRRGRRPSDP